MIHNQPACVGNTQISSTTKRRTLQIMEQCLVREFKHRLGCYGPERIARQKVAQYAFEKLLVPVVADKNKITSPNTMLKLQAVFGAAYRTKIPLDPEAFVYVQNTAEQAGADEVAHYTQQQYERFKKVHIWLKCNPIAKICRMWFPRG